MPFHHYLPAAYLSAFSYEDDSSSRGKPHRTRKVYVGDKANNNCFISAVGNVAGINNLYSLSSGDHRDIIEETWSKYETHLPKAIEKLINGKIDATLWAHILVPFIASLFVRSTNFDKRFENRLIELGVDNNYFEENPDNTNYARLLELQRLLAPVLAAEWIVLRKTGKVPLITNDLGYAPFRNAMVGDYGFAFPLNLHNILVLVAKKEREVLELSNGTWRPIIKYFDLLPNNHIELNNTLTQYAQKFIFSPEKALLQSLLEKENVSVKVPEPGEFGFISGRLARIHEQTWHRLVSFITKDYKNESSGSFNVDFSAISSSWIPPIYLLTNPSQYPSALRCQDNKVIVSFFDVEEETERE